MPTTCHICGSTQHVVYNCNAEHLPHMTIAVSQYLTALFNRIYAERQESIQWVAEQTIFTDLSLGELLYLNRDYYYYHRVSPRIQVNQSNIQIYIFIYNHLKEYLENGTFTDLVREQIWIDMGYWNYLLSNTYDLATVIELRRVSIQELYSSSYIYIQETLIEEDATRTVECPICLAEKKACSTHRFSCKHSVCISCSRRLLSVESAKCPLCRTPIRVVTAFA
jgi:hypothetical protein